VSLAVSLLTRFPPEVAHATALSVASRLPKGVLSGLAKRYRVEDPRLSVEAFGLRFPTPVGLAAGYDKDAVATRASFAFGFGHVEVGTVTRRAQPGNEGPRLFRVREREALVNRLGFPNRGVDFVCAKLRAAEERFGRPNGVLGVNIGKNKDVPLERAPEDYAALYREVSEVADYVTVNVSSPNTEGLRSLQSAENLRALLRAVSEARASCEKKPPVLVKISPDLDDEALEALVSTAVEEGVAGIVATNTTLSREGIPEYARTLVGGLSGAPLRARSLEVLRAVVAVTKGRVPVVSAGGVSSPADVVERLSAGAVLVQLYTALVYRGPALVREISQGLRVHLDRTGARSVAELAQG
jgi:dihydroorotate dehydrogenase